MLRSMTAFGRAVGSAGGKNFVCEIKSVNNRYLDCSVKLPRAYGFLEEKIIGFIRGSGISRGKIEVYIGIEVTESLGAAIEPDYSYAEAYISALKGLRDRFGLSDDISTMSVAQNRDLFIVKKPEEDTEKDWEDLLPVFRRLFAAIMLPERRRGHISERIFLLKRKIFKSLRRRYLCFPKGILLLTAKSLNHV